MVEVNPYFEKVAKERGFWSKDLIEKIAEHGSIQEFAEIPEDVRRVFVTAHDITPLDHVRMQAAFQRYTDNAVSKTVNFPHDATVKEVEEVYRQAYKLGCKGVTVYRDGSRDEQVLSTGATSRAGTGKDEPRVDDRGRIMPKERPEAMNGTTRIMKTGCGNLYVTINEDEEGNPFELFTQMGKAGGCAASQAEAIGRLVSMAFRSNIHVAEIVKQLKGISCHNKGWGPGGAILSCSDAIATAIEKFVADRKRTGVIDVRHDAEPVLALGACPECGGAVEHEGGCCVCRGCGFTRCA